MRFLPFLLLAAGACLHAQQTPPPEGPPVPLPLIPVNPAASEVDPAKVVLEVGGVKVTAKELDALIDVYPPNQQIMARGPGKDQFAANLIRMLVLAEEARKRKLDETEKFKQQMRFSEANLLAGTLNDLLKNEVDVSDPVLRKYYDEHRCEYQTWKASHILVRVKGSPLPLNPGEKDRTEEEGLARANELRKQIVDGADFAEVAKTSSDDSGSGANGGDLGNIQHGKIVPTIEEALCSMNPGELSQPVKTPFGFHLLKLISKEGKSFEELKPELEQKYRPEAARKLVDEMIAKTKVVKDPAYYAPIEVHETEIKKP